MNPKLISFIYLFGFICGIGFSIGLSTASSLINDVVGSKGEFGAFVYGAYSFTDKLSCGIILYFFVNYLKDDYSIFKYMVPLLPIGCILFSLFILGFKIQSKITNTTLLI